MRPLCPYAAAAPCPVHRTRAVFQLNELLQRCHAAVSKEVARSSHLADVHRLAIVRAEILVLIATRVQGRGAQDILAPV